LRGRPYKEEAWNGHRWRVGERCPLHGHSYHTASLNSRCGSYELSRCLSCRAWRLWSGHMSFWSQSSSFGGYTEGRPSRGETQTCLNWTGGSLFRTLSDTCFFIAFRYTDTTHVSRFRPIFTALFVAECTSYNATLDLTLAGIISFPGTALDFNRRHHHEHCMELRYMR
jgi:hypothetical protein